MTELQKLERQMEALYNPWKKGEILFEQRCEEKGWIAIDVSANPVYWDKDIDFLVRNETGKEISVEVKWDNRINSTNNLYLELTAIHSKGNRGWFEFCQADYIAYGDAVTETFYMIDRAALKQRIDNRQIETKRAACGNESSGVLVSLFDIENLIKVL